MAGNSLRRVLPRIGLLTALAALFSAATAAYHGSGSSVGLLNTYFLPANAQVSGISGLIFGVIAPLAIVMILLYLVLERVMGDSRQTKALALLMALFIIPSGGYKVISNMLLVLFSFGAGTSYGSSTLTLPFIGHVPAMDPRIVAAVVTFAISSVFFSSKHLVDRDYGFTEFIASAVAAFMVWVSMGGGLGLITAAAWLLFLWIAYEIFETGMEGARRDHFIVALIGLALFFYVLSTIEILPDELQAVSGMIASLGLFAAFVVLVITLVVIGYLLHQAGFI